MSFRPPLTLKNFNLYFEGESQAGRATEISLPKIDVKVEGQLGARFTELPVFTGEIATLQAEFKTAEFCAEIQKRVGKFPEQTSLIAMGAIGDDVTQESLAVAAVFRGWITQYQPSSWGAGKKTEDSFTMTCVYYKLAVKGIVVLEIDLAQNIYRVDGVDVVELIRNLIAT